MNKEDRKKMQEEMQGIFKKYGLSEVDEETDQSESDKNDAGEVSKVAGDLAETIAKKLAEAISNNKGISNQNDKNSLEKEVKTKIFNSWGGVTELSYPTNLKSLTKDEKIVNFFKALIYHRADDQSRNVLRALSEGTDSEGGYLVPEELRTEVYRVLPDYAIMRSLARILPMSTDTLKLNSLGARPVAYWTAEYASSSTTSADFGQTVLSPNDLVCLLPVTDQLLADANIDLVQFIIQLFAEAIALAEDQAFFTGNGSGKPKGISAYSISSRGVAGASPDLDDIIDLIDDVPSRATMSPKAAFIGHRNVKRRFRKIKDQDGDYIWRDGKGGVGGGSEVIRMPNTLYGYPFYECNFLSQSELYFGDWSMYIIGDRKRMSVTTTNVGGEAWRRNSMEIKAVERVDGKAVLTTPFAKLTGI